jgi:hypothetical protein
MMAESMYVCKDIESVGPGSIAPCATSGLDGIFGQALEDKSYHLRNNAQCLGEDT